MLIDGLASSKAELLHKSIAVVGLLVPSLWIPAACLCLSKIRRVIHVSCSRSLSAECVQCSRDQTRMLSAVVSGSLVRLCRASFSVDPLAWHLLRVSGYTTAAAGRLQNELARAAQLPMHHALGINLTTGSPLLLGVWQQAFTNVNGVFPGSIRACAKPWAVHRHRCAPAGSARSCPQTSHLHHLPRQHVPTSPRQGRLQLPEEKTMKRGTSSWARRTPS